MILTVVVMGSHPETPTVVESNIYVIGSAIDRSKGMQDCDLLETLEGNDFYNTLIKADRLAPFTPLFDYLWMGTMATAIISACHHDESPHPSMLASFHHMTGYRPHLCLYLPNQVLIASDFNHFNHIRVFDLEQPIG